MPDQPAAHDTSRTRDRKGERYLFLDKDFREGCPFASEIVTLSPYGFVYPCCGMVLGERPDRAELFIQDSLTNKTVDEIEQIIHDLKDDLFFRLLQAVGPYRSLQEVKKRQPLLITRDQFIGTCESASSSPVTPK
jgi:hypothetical protein